MTPLQLGQRGLTRPGIIDGQTHTTLHQPSRVVLTKLMVERRALGYLQLKLLGAEKELGEDLIDQRQQVGVPKLTRE